VDQLCTRVGIVDRGRLVLQDQLDAVRKPTGLVLVESPDAAEIAGQLNGRVTARDGARLLIRHEDPAELNALLVGEGFRVQRLAAERRTLEDVVFQLTGTGSDRVADDDAGDRRSPDRVAGGGASVGEGPGGVAGVRDGVAGGGAGVRERSDGAAGAGEGAAGAGERPDRAAGDRAGDWGRPDRVSGGRAGDPAKPDGHAGGGADDAGGSERVVGES
jgi:hypothetical protein